MPKFEDVRELAGRLVVEATRSADSWLSFLNSAAYTYNYAYSNQLLIHCQRPKAQAVATLDYWNNTAGRWARRGSKGIAIMDTKAPKSRLRYVFDFNDTFPRVYVPEALPWNVTSQNRQQVWNRFVEEENADCIQNAIRIKAATLVAERHPLTETSLQKAIVGCNLEWCPPEEQIHVLESIILNSVCYMAAERCGVDKDFVDFSAFDHVHELDTFAASICLGSMTQQTSRAMMRYLGDVVREIDSVARQEKSAYAMGGRKETHATEPKEVQHGVHEHQRLSGAESDTERAADAADRQIRQPAQRVSAGERPDDLRGTDLEREVVSAPAGDRADGTAADRTDDAAADATEHGTRPQDRSAGLDTVDERPEAAGRGTGDAIPVQPVKLNTKQTAEDEEPSSAVALSDTPIEDDLPEFDETYLKDILFSDTSRKSNAELIEFYESHPSLIDRIRYTRSAYQNVWTEVIAQDGSRIGYHAEHSGLLVWEGSFLTRTSQKQYSWHSVTDRFVDLIRSKELVAEIVPEDLPVSVGDGIVPDGLAEELGLPSPEKQSEAIDRMNTASPRFKVTEAKKDEDGSVITDDEINYALCRGSGFSEGKMRINHFYGTAALKTEQERLAFLKKEYGIGGCSWTFLSGVHGWVDHDGKGIKITYGNYGSSERYEKLLKWSEVDKRLRFLVETDRYLDDKGKAAYENWFAEKLTKEAEYAASMERAKRLITEYCEREEFAVPEFRDLNHINLAYTTTEDEEHELQVYVNLIRYEIVYTVDGGQYSNTQYPDNNSLCDHELEDVTFELLINEALSRYAKRYPDRVLPVTYAKEVFVPGETLIPIAGRDFLVDRINDNGTVNVQDTTPGTPSEKVFYVLPATYLRRIKEGARVYQPGDRVYLEDGAVFTLEDIGMFDIRLRDESFPLISRAINRRDFARILERDERNKGLVPPPVDMQSEGPVAAIEAMPPEPLPDDEPGDAFVDQVMADAEALAEPYQYEPINYTSPYRPEVPAGPKAKFAANIEAIRLLKSIEQRAANGGYPANADEQTVLAKYCGWGGLADALDPNKSSWSGEYSELKTLLTQSEYEAARASTLTAFYTPPEVIHSLYRALERFGVQGGNILEPSMGVGAFFGHKPSSFDLNNARLYGVELDDLTGRIARQLYQKAKIQICGYEKSNLPDSFFDCAVGNVPFGQFSVSDKAYDRLHFQIHDYFIAKTIDKVRTGGIIAFITTSGTMDKKSEDVRRYIAERCDLIGAVRLPNNAFKANAGTEVTADILFLQKRDRIITQDEPWLHLAETEDGISINGYFAEHPEMICGRMEMVSGPYGPTPTCLPDTSIPLEDQLDRAMGHLSATLTKAEVVLDSPDELPDEVIEADPLVRNFSYALVDGDIYYRENSVMRKARLGTTADSRVRKLIEMRDTVRDLIQAQLDDMPDEEISRLQKVLNQQYDAYQKEHGLINSRGSAQAFQDDSSYLLLCSLEDLDEEGKFRGKSDMFSKRTIRSARPAERVDTASDALALSIGEKARVDMTYMMQLTGKTEEELVDDLNGVIFIDPLEKESDGGNLYRTADDYLSGNVRQKLQVAKIAAETNPAYRINVSALEQVQPKDLEASDIAVRLGATWIDPEIIKQFADELVDAPWQSQRYVKIHYAPYTGVWNISGKSMTCGNIKATVTYGTPRANFYHILEESLNLRAIRIFDTVTNREGNEVRVLNAKATQEAQGKQQQIEDAFKQWLWKDQTRRQQLVKLYNEKFNSVRPREYDGSHIQFHGMNPEISLRPHQRNAIAHILYGGNTLLGHVVGAGKTFEMVAAAMEKKRLGLCSKTLICVPNHLTEQLASEALLLYPNANILVAKRTDFEKANRKRFCARIATGNYDLIVIGHSQFERIPLSKERQIMYLQRQIDEVLEQTAQLKSERAENFTIKQMERLRKQMEKKLAKLNDTERKDDVVTFEELGVDSLMVDEAHMFKNLMCVSKMRNVAGISQSESQRASDLLMKTMYLDEITGGRGVTFATGTPISNSMTELYTMMRYLQRHTLERNGLGNFDAWASTFGETVTAIELAPEGTGYRTKTRFAKFYNLPELMTMFKEAADIQTADMLKLPVPNLEGGKPINVKLQPSEIQKAMVSELGERAEVVRSGGVDPSEDNMLRITNDGRKLALDQRLIDPSLPDDPGSKVNICAENVFRIWSETKEKLLTQLVFCDLSTPKAGSFNIYDDLRGKLVAMGIPEEEIQFIHDANTETRKAELFGKVRSGAVRILMGSTAKMGAGTNVQRKLVALHHLDVPWRPSDIEQREGRMVRQGNENEEVAIYRYVTEGTFDAYSWQLIENKQKFIGQVMTSKSPARSCDDLDEAALSYAEVKALAAGNPAIKEKMDLDIQVARLKTLQAAYASQRYRLEDAIAIGFPREIQKAKEIIANCTVDASTLKANTVLDEEGKDVFSMTLMDTTYDKREDAGKALLGLIGIAMDSDQPVKLGKYKGFDLQIVYYPFGKEFHVQLVGAGIHDAQLGADVSGNITRINNAVNAIPDKITAAQNSLEQLEKQLQNAKDELAQPFAQATELAEKSKRLAELDALLNMGQKDVVLDTVSEGNQSERSVKQHER